MSKIILVSKEISFAVVVQKLQNTKDTMMIRVIYMTTRINKIKATVIARLSKTPRMKESQVASINH